jgi:hypothetical protein
VEEVMARGFEHTDAMMSRARPRYAAIADIEARELSELAALLRSGARDR